MQSQIIMWGNIYRVFHTRGRVYRVARMESNGSFRKIWATGDRITPRMNDVIAYYGKPS
jgi:hypothetical protein